jgi:hypothetical protein
LLLNLRSRLLSPHRSEHTVPMYYTNAITITLQSNTATAYMWTLLPDHRAEVRLHTPLPDIETTQRSRRPACTQYTGTQSYTAVAASCDASLYACGRAEGHSNGEAQSWPLRGRYQQQLAHTVVSCPRLHT